MLRFICRSEIEQAVKKKMNYNFAFYVMICKTCRLPDVVPPGGKANNSADVQRLFINAEEELFYEVGIDLVHY